MTVTLEDIYIIGSARTPIGAFNGGLASLTAVKLGSHAVKAALERSGVKSEEVEEVYFGNVMSANLGQNPARQVALRAGLSDSTPATTVNKVCASGMKATALGAQAIQLGQCQVVVVGGTESMSNVPFYLPNNRRAGLKYGNATIIDGIPADGLHDAYKNCPMGDYAELCATEHNITREACDDFAIRSYELARASTQDGTFDAEIAPIEIPGARGQAPTLIKIDEDSQRFDAAKLRAVRPAFPHAGSTVTGPNASSLSDGAAALVLVSGTWLKKAQASGWNKPYFQITGWSDAATAPSHFTVAPALAIPKALARADLESEKVDLYEINEAFSVVALANMQRLKLDQEKVNVLGGAVAMGHPLGCSGARILITLMTALSKKGGSNGVAAVCNGGGGAGAMVIRRIQ